MPKFKQSTSKQALRFIPLGGAGQVNRNMFAYEYGEDIIILDCGVGFPDFEMLGIDVTIPDISYLEKENRKDKVRGIIITHAHYDHFGALPHILPYLPVPVYGSKLTLEFIKMALADAGLPEKDDLFEISPENGLLELGCFKIHPFRVCHSVPDSLGFCIETPIGNIFHVSDYKFDWTPVDGRLFDVAKVTRLAAKEKPLALISDCLGANAAGYTQSEKSIKNSLEKEIESAEGQVFVVTISSNISRIKQAVEASLKVRPRVCFLGRSMEQSSLIAEKLGYLKISKKRLINPRKAKNFDQSQLIYVTAGCYGQPDSAIAKLAREEHPLVELKKDAKVIFSGDPSPPGARNAVDSVINKLILLGAQVSYYEIQENMHVSGHGSQGDIQMLMGLVRPKYFVPIGGTPKHMRSYSLLAQEMGNPAKNIFELKEGELLEFNEERRARRGRFPFQTVLVDGLRVGDIGEVVLKDRRTLADDGIVVLIVPMDPETGQISGSVEIATRGFVYVKKSKELISDLKKIVRQTAESALFRRKDWKRLRRRIEANASRLIAERTGRAPLVLPVVVEV